MLQGGTDLIMSFLEKGIDVFYLCPTRDEVEFVRHNAMYFFKHRMESYDHDNRTFRLKNGTVFRLVSLDHSQRAGDKFRGFRGVIILHPELLFEHGFHEELVETIKYRNKRHVGT